LQAQCEACEAYIASQRHEGWSLVKGSFDDGGYSGGSMERPGLQALLAAIDGGQIDVVVVYKVDRLTRSLADFARMVERFEQHGVSFVSVTQAFNTTTSMGRLTLNVLLSFAQFEREVGAERVRDKIAASKKKGIWMGGTVPLGYRVENRKLVVDAADAASVRTIFELYLTCGSTPALLTELRTRGIMTARRVSRAGLTSGGIPFGTGTIDYLLHNRVYIAEIEHKGQVYPGEHEPLLDRAVFEAVQEKLACQRNARHRLPSQMTGLLTGHIFDSRGNRMTPSHANKNGVRYRYYVSRALAEGRKHEAGHPARVPAPDVDQAVLAALRKYLEGEAKSGASKGNCSSGSQRTDKQQAAQSSPHSFECSAQTMAKASPDASHIVEPTIERIDVYPGSLLVKLRQSETIAKDDDAPEILTIPWQRPNARPRCEAVEASPDPSDEPSSAHRRLVIAVATARGWFLELATGTVPSVEAIATREGKHARSIRSTLSLAFLAPDLVEHLMECRSQILLTQTEITRNLPELWTEQRCLLERDFRR
jgi:site-specific DNA recombinase